MSLSRYIEIVDKKTNESDPLISKPMFITRRVQANEALLQNKNGDEYKKDV